MNKNSKEQYAEIQSQMSELVVIEAKRILGNINKKIAPLKRMDVLELIIVMNIEALHIKMQSAQDMIDISVITLDTLEIVVREHIMNLTIIVFEIGVKEDTDKKLSKDESDLVTNIYHYLYEDLKDVVFGMCKAAKVTKDE